MRLAPSFLFSLLMLLSIFCGQVAASASSDGLESDGLLAHHPIVTIDEEFLEELAEVEEDDETEFAELTAHGDRKSTRLNSSHLVISYAVFCLKKKKRSYPPKCTSATFIHDK